MEELLRDLHSAFMSSLQDKLIYVHGVYQLPIKSSSPASWFSMLELHIRHTWGEYSLIFRLRGGIKDSSQNTTTVVRYMWAEGSYSIDPPWFLGGLTQSSTEVASHLSDCFNISVLPH